jgi:hypothetical protein
MVWIVNLGTGLVEFRMWYVARRLEAVGDLNRLEEAATMLSAIPKASLKIEDARKKDWRTSLFLPLADVAPGYESNFIAAIHAVIDPSSGPEGEGLILGSVS